MSVQILVVDDEEDFEVLIRQKFRRAIRQGDMTFRFARNGAEALVVLHEQPNVDLVLTDINMPVMDGLTLLKHLSQVNPWLRSVVVSAYGDMANIRTAMNRGAFDFVTKPIDFNDLQVTIEKTLRQVEERKRADQQRRELGAIERDLSVAGQLQQDILPEASPRFNDWPQVKLRAFLQPARMVGGDFYDYFQLDDEHLGIVIGDVSGKGIASAFFMAVARTMIRSIALTNNDPSACLKNVNEILTRGNDSAMFVTVFYGRINVKSGLMHYCNGGHPAPLVISSDGTVRSLASNGNPALGFMGEAEYSGDSLSLEPDDQFLAYTDGITEAFDGEDKMFGYEGLLHAVRDRHAASVDELCNNLIMAVNEFQATNGQTDDIALLALQCAR